MLTRAGLTATVRQIENWAGLSRADHPVDEALLARFATDGDPAAFETLVRRHAGLVWRTCRAVLRHDQDAEDATQATFIALARSAGGIQKPGALPGWLHGVARRTALAARRAAAIRRAHESRHPATMNGHETASLAELQEILDEEIQRLPEKYRVPFVLCHLEGRPRAATARDLGYLEGTLNSRLARARALLRARLTRRGVELTAALAALAVNAGSVPALPAAPVVNSIVRAGLRSATGPAGFPPAVESAGSLRSANFPRARLAFWGTSLLVVAAVGLKLLDGPPGDQPVPAPREQPSPVTRTIRDGAGDPLPPGAVARIGTVRFRHGRKVTGVSYSPDGKTLVASGGGRVTVWDARTGEPIRELEGQSHWVTPVAFARDGKTLAAGTSAEAFGEADEVVVWDAGTGKVLARRKGHKGTILCVAYSPDGKRIASGDSTNAILVWAADAGTPPRELAGHGDAIRWLAFAPDGNTLASAGKDNSVRLWDPKTGTEKGRLAIAANRVEFSADGKHLITAVEGTVMVWDVATFKELRRLPVPSGRGEMPIFAQVPGRDLVAVGGTRGEPVTLWDSATGKEAFRISGAGPVWCLTFSPDGATLVSGRRYENTVRLWDVATGKELHPTTDPRTEVRGISLSPRGDVLTTTEMDGSLRLWNPDSGRPLKRLVATGRSRDETCFSDFAQSPDGKLVGLGGRAVRLWDVATGRERSEGWYPPAPDYAVMSVTFSPDGKQLAFGDGKTIRVWDVGTGTESRNWAGKCQGVTCLAFSPDGSILAGAGQTTESEAHIVLWDVATGRERRTLAGHPGWVTRLAFSPDGRCLASIGTDRTVRLWNASTGVEIGHRPEEPEPMSHRAAGLAFSSDGRTLASGSGSGGIDLWEVATLTRRGRFEGHRGPVNSLHFTANGCRLVSGSEDGTALVWDLNVGGKLLPAALSAAAATELWADLGKDDAERAYRAIQALAAHPDRLGVLAADRLKAVPVPDPERLSKLVSELDAPEFQDRERATRDLAVLGDAAVPALRKLQAGSPSPEAARRVRDLLGRVERQQLSASLRQALRAVEALERAGTSKARDELRRLANGAPGSRLTEDARASLARLERGVGKD